MGLGVGAGQVDSTLVGSAPVGCAADYPALCWQRGRAGAGQPWGCRMGRQQGTH